MAAIAPGLSAISGFKDITRIASSSPTMWQHICLTNTDNISSLLEQYIQDLTAFKRKLDAKDTDVLYRFFDDARIYRESFINVSSGPIKTEYVLTVDIARAIRLLYFHAASLWYWLSCFCSICRLSAVMNDKRRQGSFLSEVFRYGCLRSVYAFM